MAETVKVKGLKELDNALAKLPKAVGFKALRSGMMEASRPMFLAAKANAASTGIRGYDAGATAQAMGRYTRKLSPTRTGLFIGPKNKDKKALALWNQKHGREAKRLRHFHLLEFGSEHGPAQPYLRPAFESTKMVVVNNFRASLKKHIEKQAAILARGAKR